MINWNLKYNINILYVYIVMEHYKIQTNKEKKIYIVFLIGNSKSLNIFAVKIFNFKIY